MKRLAWMAAAAALISGSPAFGLTAPDQPKIAAAPELVNLQKSTHLYATTAGQKLYLDRIFDPNVKITGKRPVIIYSYGGGWAEGKRDDAFFVPLVRHFASRGFTLIFIDYRLGIKIAKDRKEMTPANGTEMYLRAIQWGVEDLFDATTFILKHADAWNLDENQITIMGGSAGATNSLVAEFNVANETDLAKSRLPAGFRYAGVISMAGAFWLKANTPLTFKNKPAPIMFFHGAKDQLVTYDEVQGAFSGYGPVSFARRFAGPSFPKWFVDYPQGDHILALWPATDQLNEMTAFLEKLVKERQQISIHTIEEDKSPKNFSNFIKTFAPNKK